MTILVVGASGATGRLLVKQLLDRGHNVKVIVRSPDKLPAEVRNHDRATVIHAGAWGLRDAELAGHVNGCEAVASCLGHNISFKGIYGAPQMLVTDTTRRLCEAISSNKPKSPVRFVLMNTAGNSNRDLQEKISFAEKCVVGFIRLLLPPHRDNESAADFLRTRVGQHHAAIEWVVVRPDTLRDDNEVTAYHAYPSPIRSAIFNSGVTSRSNVGHFMAALLTEDGIWKEWKGQMPVIYNETPSQPVPYRREQRRGFGSPPSLSVLSIGAKNHPSCIRTVIL